MGYVNIPERFFDINEIKERVGIYAKHRLRTKNGENIKNYVSKDKIW